MAKRSDPEVQQYMKEKELEKQKIKERYETLRNEMSVHRHNDTLNTFFLLSEAFKLGKQINPRFNLKKLSEDFLTPFTTARRILSLEKANKKTWELIHSNKISAFKACMILMQKGESNQDKYIQEAIDNNLSTYQIKKDLEVLPKSERDLFRLKSLIPNTPSFYNSLTNYSSRMLILTDMALKNKEKIIKCDCVIDKLIRIKQNIGELLNEKKKSIENKRKNL